MNSKLHAERKNKLERAGAFRVVLPRSTWARAGQPRYGDKVYTLKETSEQKAVATDGTTVLIRDTLPAPLGSKDTAVPRILKGGRQARDQESKVILQKYATILRRALQKGPCPCRRPG